MKLIKAGIWFVLILLPFSWVNRLHVQEVKVKQQMDTAYNVVIDTAVDDAMSALNDRGLWVQEEASGYESNKNIELPFDHSIQVLWDSLAVQLHITDDLNAIETLKSWFPMLVTIEYDGYRLYQWQEYKDQQNNVQLQHVWQPKKGYTYRDEQDRIYMFTLDDYVTVYDSKTQHWVSGYQRELQFTSAIPLIQDTELFEIVRKQKIIEHIQNSAQQYMNEYNRKYARNGRSYQFTFPVITEEEWHNSLQDVGLFVFVQGTPLGTSNQNRYAYGGARIISRGALYGTIVNGIKVAYPEVCKLNPFQDVFDSEYDAASKGYFPKRCGS